MSASAAEVFPATSSDHHDVQTSGSGIDSSAVQSALASTEGPPDAGGNQCVVASGVDDAAVPGDEECGREEGGSEEGGSVEDGSGEGGSEQDGDGDNSRDSAGDEEDAGGEGVSEHESDDGTSTEAGSHGRPSSRRSGGATTDTAGDDDGDAEDEGTRGSLPPWPSAMPPVAPPESVDVLRFFAAEADGTAEDCTANAVAAASRGCALGDRDGAAHFREAALLGMLPASYLAPGAGTGAREVHLNTHEPFCLVTVGVQGGGKSHTMACVLEACLVPFPEAGVVRLSAAPMTALVLHFDNSVASVVEATGLAEPHPALHRLLGAAAAPGRALPRDRLVVLASPSYYLQRRAFYARSGCTVRPLLFRWASLTADHIKRLMRVKDGDNQLYMAGLLGLLRRYQREGAVPAFPAFLAEVTAMCNLEGQRGPLAQRLALLEAVVAESDVNKDLASVGADLAAACRLGGSDAAGGGGCTNCYGTLVVADLTDPMLAGEEANGVFQVLTEQFRALPLGGRGKLLALDEAHKFMDGVASDGLSAAVVNVARLMRHDGVRLAVSTQSPKALAPELLELVTVAVLHRFHSRDWFAHLQSKVPLAGRAWAALMALQPGDALVFASRHCVRQAATAQRAAAGSAEADNGGGSGGGEEAAGSERRLGDNVFPLRVRARITADRGASRVNAFAAELVPAVSAAGGVEPADEVIVSRAAAGAAAARFPGAAKAAGQAARRKTNASPAAAAAAAAGYASHVAAAPRQLYPQGPGAPYSSPKPYPQQQHSSFPQSQLPTQPAQSPPPAAVVPPATLLAAVLRALNRHGPMLLWDLQMAVPAHLRPVGGPVAFEAAARALRGVDAVPALRGGTLFSVTPPAAAGAAAAGAGAASATRLPSAAGAHASAAGAKSAAAATPPTAVHTPAKPASGSSPAAAAAAASPAGVAAGAATSASSSRGALVALVRQLLEEAPGGRLGGAALGNAIPAEMRPASRFTQAIAALPGVQLVGTGTAAYFTLAS